MNRRRLLAALLSSLAGFAFLVRTKRALKSIQQRSSFRTLELSRVARPSRSDGRGEWKSTHNHNSFKAILFASDLTSCPQRGIRPEGATVCSHGWSEMAAGHRTQPVESAPHKHSPRRGGRILLSLTALILIYASTADAAEPLPASLHTVDGQSFRGTITSVESDILSLSVDGSQRQFPIDDLISINLAAPAQPTAHSWLLLSNGDRAPLTPIDLVDDAFLCRWEDASQRASWRVPLELVTALLRQPLSVKEDVSLLPELSRRAFTEDTFILNDGTRLAGALEGVTADTFRVETAVGIVPVEASRIAAVAMNTALVQRPDPPERSALVILRDGTWLTLHNFAISADHSLTGRTGFDAELKVPLADVARITCYGPHVIDLTRRAPLKVTTVPFVSRKHELQINRNVRGEWLELHDRTHARGFGMTSGMSATFDLEPGDRQFLATVGIDDSVGPAGSVVFAVDLDGERLFASPVVRGADTPLTIGPLEIAGGKTLTLSVEFANYGHMQDIANWCDPLILR